MYVRNIFLFRSLDVHFKKFIYSQDLYEIIIRYVIVQNIRNRAIAFAAVNQQFFGFLTANGVMIPEKRAAGFAFEHPGQIAAVYEQGARNLFQGKLSFTVFPDKVSGLARQALSGGNSLRSSHASSSW